MATPRQIADACRLVAQAADRAERLTTDKTRQQTQVIATAAELQVALDAFNAAVDNLKTLVNAP